MPLNISVLFGIFAVSLICQCSSLSANKTDFDDDIDTYYPNESWSDSFDWHLLKEFSLRSKNVLISPISLKISLALLYEGSSGGTEREFQNALQFGKKDTLRENFKLLIEALESANDRSYVLDIGTRVFMDSEIKPKQQFEAKALHYYHTKIEPTYFSNPANASSTINLWVKNLTHGHITELVKSDDLTDAIMLIANSIYFKGTWRHQFPKNQTSLGGFYVTPSDTVSVPFMHTTGTFFFYESNTFDAKILRLPYKGGRYCMFIVLPNSRGGLSNLIEKINLLELHRQLYFLDKVPVDVRLPKFKFNYQARFSNVLQKFGMRQIFQNTVSLPGIARGNSSLLRRLVVSDIIQKSGIELDETGSIVYTATDITIGNKFGETENVFNASHPFLFFIEEQTNGTILFIGKVDNPLEEVGVPLPSRLADDESSIPVSIPVNKIPLGDAGIALAEAEPVNNLQPVFNSLETNAINNRFNYFDLELLREFSEIDQNVFISPASIKTTLAMILEGASGLSAEEIGHALRINDVDEVDIRNILTKLLYDLNDRTGLTKLEASNSIFVSNKLKVLPDYQKKIADYYKGTTKLIDFTDTKRAALIINSWIYNATHGTIREVLTPESIDPETSVILSNALYFKGKWQVPFSPKITKSKCFKSPKGCVNAAMMQIANPFNYAFIHELNAHALELPYQDKFSMLLLVPTSQHTVKLLAKDMQHARFSDIIGSLKLTEVILELPKFSIDNSLDLIKYLVPLKIREIFNSKANLTGIIANDNVRISNLSHKTHIEVDEEGTVAAAITDAVVIPLIGTETQRVTADHPFIFFIYNRESNNIIFEGILKEPQFQSLRSPLRRS